MHENLRWKLSTLAALGACAFLAIHPVRPAGGAAPEAHARQHQNGFLGGLLGASDPEGAAEHHVGRHLAELYAATTSQGTCEAISSLGTAAAGDEEATTALGERSTDKYPYAVRECAIVALGTVRTGAARSWLGDRLADPDRAVRRLAIDALAATDDDEARRMLLGLARSGAEADRIAALVALGAHHVREAGPLVLDALDRATSADVRERLVRALGAAGDPAGVPKLLDLAKNGPGPMRAAALSALGELGGDGAAGALEQAMLSGGPQDAEVAAMALGGMKDGRGKAALLAATQDGRRAVSSAALRALAQLEGDDVRQVMLGALGSADQETSRAAMQWFSAKRDAGAVPELRAMATGGTQGVATEALAALATIATDDATSAIEQIATAPGPMQGQAMSRLAATPGGSEKSRAVAARLVKEGGQNAQLALGVLEGDASPEARAALLDAAKGEGGLAPAAMSALARSGEPAALRSLAELAQRGKKGQRENALAALGSTGDPRALPALVLALHAADANLKRTAINALAELGGPDAERAVLDATSSPDVGVKMSAVTALGRLGTTSADGPLERLAQDKDPNVARVALGALVRHAPGRAGALVDRAMRAGDTRSRVHAVAMASSFDSATAARLVRAGLNDADDGVAETAMRRLGDLGGSDAISALAGVLTDARASDARKRSAADTLVEMGAAGGAQSRLVAQYRTPEDSGDEDGDDDGARFHGRFID